MAHNTPTDMASSNVALVLGGVVLVLACGVGVFAFSASTGLSALVAGSVGIGALFGWVGARWNAKRNMGQIGGTTPSVAFVQATETEPDAATNAAATMRFARSAIEATPNPVVILDKNGLVAMSNLAARARFSLGNSRVPFASVVRRPDLIDAVESALATKTSVALAMETRVPVDRYERASVSAFDAGGLTFIMVSIADETEARMSERMRADFLANASHELRTPLASIIGFIETLRGPARDDEVARERFLEVMHNQALRMSRLISDLLSLSRIELNEHVPPTGQSDIASTVYEAADILQPELKKRLVLDVPKEPIWVLGDRDEMAQVVTNLIDNAIKYSTPNTKVSVMVRGGLEREDARELAMRQWSEAARLPLTSSPIEKGRRYSVLRVENLGEGIERQHLPRLSERFFRVHDTASGKSGTGLGLAIVKHIVSRHRGGLKVESEVGRGSAFSVLLPQPFDVADADAGAQTRA